MRGRVFRVIRLRVSLVTRARVRMVRVRCWVSRVGFVLTVGMGVEFVRLVVTFRVVIRVARVVLLLWVMCPLMCRMVLVVFVIRRMRLVGVVASLIVCVMSVTTRDGRRIVLEGVICGTGVAVLVGFELSV